MTRRSLAALPLILASSLAAGRGLAQTPIARSDLDQISLFASQRDDLLGAGRDLLDAFLGGDDAAFAGMIDDPVLASMSATGQMMWLESGRIRMRSTDAGLVLDGRFDGSGTMTGFAWNRRASQFVATSDTDQAQSYPTGRWSGTLAPGVRDEPFALTFTGGAESLQATLDLPARDVAGAPLVVSSPETQPVGDRVQDQALPLSPVSQVYRAEHVWGDALIVFEALRGPEGGFIGFATSLHDLLPPDPALHLEPAVTYRLPADGPLLVFWGGTTEFQNYHAVNRAQRHALDLVQWADGSTFRTDGMTNKDYLIWGQPMLAPTAGTVVGLLNDEIDILPSIAQDAITQSTPVASGQARHPAGNHVVIEAAAGTFVYLCHMQQGSVAVTIGDTIEAGDQVGLIGNSGNTSEPHIHMHAQSSADLFDPGTIGLPIVFDAYLADGVATAMDSPVQGQFVEQQ